MRPLTLASITAWSFGCTVPTTSSTAGCFTVSIFCTRTAAGGRLSPVAACGSCFLPQPATKAISDQKHSEKGCRPEVKRGS